MNRVADNSLAKRLLDWEPQVKFMDGLYRTIEWYFATNNSAEVRAKLDFLLTKCTKETPGAPRVSAVAKA